MNSRLVSTGDDVNIDELTEEELEAYLAKLDQESEITLNRMEELDNKKNVLQKQVKEYSSKIEELDNELSDIEKREVLLAEERQQIIDEALKNTGKVTKFDLSKLQIDGASFMEIIRRGLPQKDSTLGSEKYTPPSSEKRSTSSVDSSTPLSKVSSSDDSRNFYSLSLSSRSDSNSSDEKDKPKDSPSIKPTLSSQAMVSVLLPPSAVALSTSTKADVVKSSVGLVQPNGDKTTLSSEKNQKQQVPAATASKTSVPQQNKGLLAKLGFNRDKPAASVTPVVAQQPNGFRSGH